MYNRCRDKSLVQAVVGKYDDLPRLRLTAHHRRPKAGPSIQSSQRERNPKGSHRLLCAIAERLGQRLWKTHDCAYTYLADHCDLRKPLCHLYTYNRRSGSLKVHFDVILATTVSYFAAKTSQWSRQSYQKCSDARKSFKKLASRTEGGTLCEMRAAIQGFGAKSLRRKQ